MINLKKEDRGSIARIISFIVLFGILPAWFFYIGIRFNETLNTLGVNKEKTQNYLVNGNDK